MRLTITIIISLLALNFSWGKNTVRFTAFGTSDGISVGKARKITQDNYGFIWIATEDGLNRFNGISFEIFRNTIGDSTSIINNKIFDILQGPNNKLWVATSEGLCDFNQITGKFETLNNNLKHLEIWNLSISNDTTLYIGTRSNGLFKLNLLSYNVEPIKLNENIKFIRGTKVINDNLYIGTDGQGFCILNLKTNKIESKSTSIKINDTYINQINDFVRVSKNLVWIGTENGLFSYKINENTITNITPKKLFNENKQPLRIRSLIKDKDKIIWITTNKGLLKYKPKYTKNSATLIKKDKNNPTSLSSNWLLSVYEDKAGNIWISNKENGIDLLHDKNIKFKHFGYSKNQSSQTNNIVMSLAKYESNQILVGSLGGGLSQFDTKSETFYNFNKHQRTISKSILSINVQAYNSIWIGTWGDGLQNINPETGQITTYKKNTNDSTTISNNSVLCLQEDQKQGLWIGTFNGLNYFSFKTKRFTRYKIPNIKSQTIYCIFTNNPNILWLGTRNEGLIEYNIRTKNTTIYKHSLTDTNSISSNVVRYIYQDKNKIMWIATEVGLSKFDTNSKKFFNYSTKQGLPNNNVWTIKGDTKNNIWLSTNNGLSKITQLKNNKIKIKNYNKNDGINDLEFSQGAVLYDNETKEIYFGGTNGFYVFNPAKIKPRKNKPPVQITSIKIMNKEYNGDTVTFNKKCLTIPYNKNFLSFEFYALEYPGAKNVLYKYKMEGQSNQWSQVSNRNFVSFPDLKDGEYILHIKSTNSEGYWNDKETTIHITVTPPWYRTTIFYIISVISIILGIIGFITWRTNKLKQEKRILELTVEERTKELQKKNRNITSSIQYAQRIQQSIIFPCINSFASEFKKTFVLFKPKDIVSGDFFWFTRKGNTKIFAAADCTGHGVPGAFMSIIGNSLLNEIISKMDNPDPASILTQLDKKIKQALHQEGRKTDTFDGMDIALCTINDNSNKLIYSGAYNPLYHIHDNKLTKYNAFRASIGGSQLKKEKHFFNHTINVEKGDTIYIFSDGIADQFGGENNRKFSSKQLQQLLLSIQDERITTQQFIIEQEIEKWMADYEQIDDMLLVGVMF